LLLAVLLFAVLAALVVLPAPLAAVVVLVLALELPLEVALEVLLLLPPLFASALPELVFALPLLPLLTPPAVTVNLLQSSWAPRCASYDIIVSRRN
jgi:hypothetical protein